MPSADERISKGTNFFVPCLQYCRFEQDSWKAEPFSWRSVEDELAVKYLENLDV